MKSGRLPDAIVIGAGIGGLSAAIHLRLQGREVRVYEANAAAGGRASYLESEGVRFDTGPTLLNYPWVFEDLFRAAGKRLSDYLELLPVDPSITYRWPDGGHLTLSSNAERLEAEFERVEPGAARGLAAFMADAGEKFRIAFEELVPRNEDSALAYFSRLSLREVLRTALWRSMYGELGKFFRSRRIREALGSYAMYLGGSPYELPGLFTILPYGELAQGLWLPRGGIYSLAEAMEKLARQLGVRIQFGARVRRIQQEGGCVSGVQLEEGEKVSCGTVVSNVDLPVTLSELLEQEPPRIKMSPSALTFYWVVRGTPAGLGHHSIFLPADYRRAFDALISGEAVPADPAFYTAAPAASDPGLRKNGLSAVFVLVPVPLASRLGGTDWGQEAQRAREFVLARLKESGADLAASRILRETIYTPLDWQRRFSLFDGSAFGAAHTLNQMGPFRPRNYSRRIRGLYFTGASTTPGTGLPMVALSGKLTAERIRSHAR